VRYGSMGRTGFGWLKTGSGGGLLWIWQWNYGIHKENRLFFDKLIDYRLHCNWYQQ
jgi:hypothetical protein